MGLKRKILKSFKKFSAGISYRLLDEDKLFDASNVFDNKGETATRYGIKRFNTTSLGGSVLSISYFKDTSGNRFRLAKVGTVLHKVNATGAATSIKTGLSATTKHRGITLNNRHIIAIENDGLFSYDGTTFTQLGQDPGSAPTAAKAAGGSLTDATYIVGYTFLASTIGFESNISAASSQVTTETSNNTINVSAIPSTAANALINKIRIYLKNETTAGEFLFVAEINLGVTTHSITENPASTRIPPTTHAKPIAGGGKFLTNFGKKLAYTGNTSFKNDVYISEDYLPDAFDDTDTGVVLSIDGQGPVTGIAQGLFNDSILDPYIVIFKKTTTVIYSELSGISRQVTIDEHIGCVAHDTIRVSNGIVYFMSENGWYRIFNGALLKDQQNEPVSLGAGDIDDIFSREGWVNQLNSSQFSNFFSAYYPTLNHYMTFVAEGSNSAFSKIYVYEKAINGFRVFNFKTIMTSMTEGEDDNGVQVVYMADESGTLFQYSVKNELHDEDKDGNSQSISAFAIIPWNLNDDLDSTFNYRQLIVRALSSDNGITVRTFFNFNMQDITLRDYDFPNPISGFILDVSKLDEGVFGDERTPVSVTSDISRTAESILIGFYQDITDANMGLLSAQLHYNKNGNRNL